MYGDSCGGDGDAGAGALRGCCTAEGEGLRWLLLAIALREWQCGLRNLAVLPAEKKSKAESFDAHVGL